jgi:hypothetical protein
MGWESSHICKEVSPMTLPRIHHPAHLEAVKPLVLYRKHLAAAHPVFEQMRSDVIQFIKTEGAKMPFSVAVLVASELLQPVLQQHWQNAGIEAGSASAHALVVYLPELFAEVAGEVATKPPEVFNAPQLDLLGNATYLGWRVEFPGEDAPTVVRLPELALRSALSKTYVYMTRDWGWVPVVVVAGGAVAVGGFLVDESMVLDLQCATMSAQCCNPEDAYSEDRLRFAAELATVLGLEPWMYARWYDQVAWAVQPRLFSFNG